MQGAPVPTPSCVFRLVLPGSLATTFAYSWPNPIASSAQHRYELDYFETFLYFSQLLSVSVLGFVSSPVLLLWALLCDTIQRANKGWVCLPRLCFGGTRTSAGYSISSLAVCPTRVGQSELGWPASKELLTYVLGMSYEQRSTCLVDQEVSNR